MKKCPGCNYLWADDYNGTCLECGKPLGGGGGGVNQDLQFRYAGQLQAAQRERQLEQDLQANARSKRPARPGDAYDRMQLPPGLLEVARNMIVQRAEVEYDVDDAA